MRLKVSLIILSVLIYTCGSNVEPKIIDINKTQKIQSIQSWETAEELLFLWTPPKGPKGNDSKWIINDDIMLFTPDIPGEYSISLIIENMSGNILGEESFLFIAEEKSEKLDPSTSLTKTSTNRSLITEEANEEKVNLPTSTPITKKPAKNNISDNRPYTIQVAAWPSLEEAKKDQISLTKYGIDAYTQRIFIDKEKAYWWRVRVGSFSNKDQLNLVKKQIEDLRGSPVWIDRIDED